MTTQAYQQASQRFLAQAKQELAAGDLQQASEKGWGAATQMLKAIAQQGSWEHGKHRHLSRAASRLLRHEWQPISVTAQAIEAAVTELLSDPAQATLAERQIQTA